MVAALEECGGVVNPVLSPTADTRGVFGYREVPRPDAFSNNPPVLPCSLKVDAAQVGGGVVFSSAEEECCEAVERFRGTKYDVDTGSAPVVTERPLVPVSASVVLGIISDT